MPYTPPSGGSVGLGFLSGYAAPTSDVNLEFDTVTANIRQAGLHFPSSAVSTPSIRGDRKLLHQGADSAVFGTALVQASADRIYPTPIDNSIVVGTPEYVRWPRTLTVTSIDEPTWPLGDGRVRLLGGYNAPPASTVQLNWLDELYAVPPGSSVALDFGALGSGRILGVTLGSQLTFGSTTVSQPLGALVPGIASTLTFGSTAVVFTTRYIYQTTWTSSTFGTAEVVLDDFGVYPGGIAPPPDSGPDDERQLPSPVVDFRVRYAYPTGIALPVAQVPVTHIVTHEIQFIDFAGRGINSAQYGTPSIDYRVRYIEPPYFISFGFGSTNIAHVQGLQPVGWDSSEFSTGAQLDINLQRIFPDSGPFDPAIYGTTAIRNAFEHVRPAGWLSDTFNFPVIHNKNQYLFVQPYMNTNSSPTQWPAYSPLVENVDRNVGAFGWQSSRFAFFALNIRNNAVPITPAGLDATLWGPETFIAYRNREVAPTPWVEFSPTQGTIVHNGARVVTPASWTSSAMGRPDPVKNLNQTVAVIFPPGPEVFGTAFVAPSIRYVYPTFYYGFPQGFPEVRLNPHPIVPIGIAPPDRGAHDVAHRPPSLVAPASTNVYPYSMVSAPRIENRNKEIYVYPSDQALYGRATVFNKNAHITITAGDTARYGAHLVEYRTRNIRTVTIGPPVISVLHRVQNQIPDPPAPQRAEPPSIAPFGVGAHSIAIRGIFADGIPPGTVGAASVSRNQIDVTPGVDFTLDQLGTPSILGALQFCYPSTIPWPNNGTEENPLGDSDVFWSEDHRVDPFTIYAPSSDTATYQATRNNPGRPGEKMDEALASAEGQWSFGGGWPVFGRPDVSLYNRVIYPSSAVNTPVFGNAEFTSRLQYITAPPIRSLRMGLPRFLNVPQYINFNTHGQGMPSSVAFGTTVVAFPDDGIDDIFPPSIPAAAFGTTAIELKNRQVYPSGVPHRGNPQQQLTTPWGDALVGYPRVYVIGGEILTLWGVPRVEHKIRSVYPEGWESLTLIDEDLGSFGQRMRVTRRNPPGGIVGIASTLMFGTSKVEHADRTIYGRGIDPLGAGRPVVTGVSYIAPTGWFSTVFGDIDRWEEGIVKPHGDDMSVLGTPRMCHAVPPASIYDSIMPSPRMARPIYVYGMPEIGFDGPAVTDSTGCGVRVTVPLPVLSTSTVSTPTVTTS